MLELEKQMKNKTLNRKLHNALDFEWKLFRPVRLWNESFKTCQLLNGINDFFRSVRFWVQCFSINVSEEEILFWKSGFQLNFFKKIRSRQNFFIWKITRSLKILQKNNQFIAFGVFFKKHDFEIKFSVEQQILKKKFIKTQVLNCPFWEIFSFRNKFFSHKGKFAIKELTKCQILNWLFSSCEYSFHYVLIFQLNYYSPISFWFKKFNHLFWNPNLAPPHLIYPMFSFKQQCSITAYNIIVN